VNAAPRREQATVPAALRRPAILAVAVASMIVIVLGVRYAGGTTPRWLDLRIDTALDLGHAHRRAWWAVLRLGNPLMAIAVPTLLAASAYLAGRRRLALLAIVGPALTGTAVLVLKPLIGRTLRGDFAFPSGQTAGATACGLVAGLLIISVLHLDRWTAGLLLGMVVLISGGATAIALTIYHWHYSTDTVGGLCTAVAVVLGAALLCDQASGWRTMKRG
jgi:undecaprenyl-diphosphatase